MNDEENKPTEDGCAHCLPSFDEEACKSLAIFRDYREVRNTWPRFSGTCTECGYSGIRYASFAHYLWGDW